MALPDDAAAARVDAAASSRTLGDLPAELLLAVAVRLPTAADAQRLLCQTSRAVRQRVEGHLGALPPAWLLHNHPTTALTRAARRGDAPLLSALLAAPGERPDKDEALVAAAGTGILSALELLLAAGAAPQAGLVAAAGAGVREAVRALVAAGADPFADGGTAVRAAFTPAGPHAGVLRDMVGHRGHWLVKIGEVACFTAGVLRGLCDPLVAAARAGDWAAAEALLRSGHVQRRVPKPLGINTLGRDVLIGWAAEAAGDAGHGNVAVRLVAAAQSDEGRDTAHRWALRAAAFRGQIAAMQQLMEHWAGSLGSVLKVACRNGSVEAVRVLRTAGAEVDSGVLLAAAEPHEGDAVAVLRVLLDSGGTHPHAWNSALERACYCGSEAGARALLEACRGRGILDLEEALTAAVLRDHSGIVQALLEHGALVEGLGPGRLMQYAERPNNATRQALQAAGVDFGGEDAVAAAAKQAAARDRRKGAE